MAESQPVKVSVPDRGVVFAESIHAGDFQMEERREAFHKLLFVRSGLTVLEQRSSKSGLTNSEGRRGTLWIIPAGTRHRIIDRAPSVLLLLCLGRDFPQDSEQQKLWQRLAKPIGEAQALGPQVTEMENIWRRAILEGERKQAGYLLLQQAMAWQLLVATSRLGAPREISARQRIHHFCESMADTLYDPWTLDSAAAAAGLSRRQFSKLFRQETGQTFVEHLTETRLGYAERLLLAGRSTVTGAAFSAGFDDLSHFYRLFRKRHGSPPLAWLKKQRADEEESESIRP